MEKKLKRKEIKYKKIGENYLFENGVGVNEISLNIYLLCNENTKEEIFEKFKKEYNLEMEDIKEVKKDIFNCLNELVEGELIEIMEK